MEELLFGRRYRATEKIGTGGMADVYKAVDEVLGRTVAVKVMHARFAADPRFAARFRQEAQAAANLVSPNIVNMYDWGQDGDTYYIVMEYVRGSDLKSIITERGALPSRTVAGIGVQVCSALSVAHGYDVIHRDIKPHNIMVQPDGAAKVMDFGIARTGNTTMTQTGSVYGTAQYLSPEQAQGHHLTGASDLYSLGVVLYEAVTGRLPFDGDTPMAVALKHVNEQALSPLVVKPDVDPALAAVITKAMQKDTGDRYVSADDLRRDLSALVQGPLAHVAAGLASVEDATTVLPRTDLTAVMPRVDYSSAGSDTRPPRANQRGSRRRTRWPLAVLAVLLALGGLAVAWGAGRSGGRVTARADSLSAVSAVSQSRPVPDVRSMTLDSARAALQQAGFVVGSVEKTSSDSIAAGSVISQSPESTKTAEQGSTVDLAVSSGPRMIAVPSVIGMSETDAVKALTDAGFVPQALPQEFSQDVDPNTVSRQAPTGEETALAGSVVNYVVSATFTGKDKKHPGDNWKSD